MSSVPAPRSAWTPARLRRANVVVGLAHAAQAVAILALSNGFSIPVTGTFMEGPPGTDPGPQETLFEAPFAPLIATFLALAAIDHLLVAAPRVNGWYERGLGRGRNDARWLEYSFSASLMIGLIALLTGITEVTALVPILFVNAAMILFGALMERFNPPERAGVSWAPFVFGCVAGIGPWVAITIAIVGAESGPGSVPGFVYGIYVSLFALFNCFAVNQLLQYRGRGRWSDPWFAEAVYIGLSLVAKSALAWQVFAGALAA
jgi:hypothetical protein